MASLAATDRHGATLIVVSTSEIEGEIVGNGQTTEGLRRDFERERWLGEIQTFLEWMTEASPDETCRTFALNLWKQTAEFTDE